MDPGSNPGGSIKEKGVRSLDLQSLEKHSTKRHYANELVTDVFDLSRFNKGVLDKYKQVTQAEDYLNKSCNNQIKIPRFNNNVI